jgi:hypothetical protein
MGGLTIGNILEVEFGICAAFSDGSVLGVRACFEVELLYDTHSAHR